MSSSFSSHESSLHSCKLKSDVYFFWSVYSHLISIFKFIAHQNTIKKSVILSNPCWFFSCQSKLYIMCRAQLTCETSKCMYELPVCISESNLWSVHPSSKACSFVCSFVLHSGLSKLQFLSYLRKKNYVTQLQQAYAFSLHLCTVYAIRWSYLIFVIFCTPPHLLASKLYARKVRKFVTKQRKSILGVLVFWLV